MPHFKLTSDEYWKMPPGLEKFESIVPTLRLALFPMGEVENDPPAALVLKADPGHTFNHHCHLTERFEVVVQGSLIVGDQVLGPGDVMVARPGEFYGPHVAGPEGCITVEVFGRLAGAYTPVYEDGQGAYLQINSLTGEMTRLEDVNAPTLTAADVHG